MSSNFFVNLVWETIFFIGGLTITYYVVIPALNIKEGSMEYYGILFTAIAIMEIFFYKVEKSYLKRVKDDG